jgi:hypothetical protein
MEKLPAELVHVICAHLSPPLASYATVSRPWQQAVESRTFFSVTVDSDPASFAEFQAVFAAAHRRALLRQLVFVVDLPAPSEKRIRKLQSRREATANAEIYTRAVIALFTFLRTWEHDGHAGLALTLCATSPLKRHPNKHGYSSGTRLLWVVRNLLGPVGLDSGALLASGGLPVVPVVSSVATGWWPNRRIDPAVIPWVARAVPNAGAMMWDFFAVPRRLPGLRRSERLSLANALTSVANADLGLLTALEIHWQDADPYNEAFVPDSLVDPASGRDPLSVAFRQLSRLPSLRDLELTGCHVLGSEMFEDPESSAANPAPMWPALTHLKLCMSATTPDGRWYFAGDAPSAEHDGSTDSPTSEPTHSDTSDADLAPGHAWVRVRDDANNMFCRFRSTPDSTALTPFVLSMARAVARMPVLRRLELAVGWDETRPGIQADYFGAEEPPGRSTAVMKPSAEAFHATHLREPRWVLFLRDLDPGWSMPPEWKAALANSSSQGCIFVTGTMLQEEVF